MELHIQEFRRIPPIVQILTQGKIIPSFDITMPISLATVFPRVRFGGISSHGSGARILLRADRFQAIPIAQSLVGKCCGVFLCKSQTRMPTSCVHCYTSC